MQIRKFSEAAFTQRWAAVGTQQLGLAVFREISFGVLTTSSGQQLTRRLTGLCSSLSLLSPRSPGESREDGQV